MANIRFQQQELREEIKALKTILHSKAPVVLNIVCFRFIKKGLSEIELNALNKEILMQLHEQGLHAPSSTVLDGKYVIRCANVNHRLSIKDYDALVEDVVRIGKTL